MQPENRPITAVFYIDRGEPEMKTPSIYAPEYTSIKDFGVYPLLYVHGMTDRNESNIEGIVRHNILKKKGESQNLRVLLTRGTLVDLYTLHGKPWLLCADKICEYKTSMKNFDANVREMKIDYNKVVFSSTFACTKRIKDALLKRDDPAVNMLQHLLEKLKETTNKQPLGDLTWLKNFIKDSYELYIWHGNQIGIISYRSIIQNIYHKYIETNLSDILGLYWYKQSDNLHHFVKNLFTSQED